MKAKLPFLNALMGLMILFAISFQSLHSFEHLAKQLSEKPCKHVYNHHKTEVSHSHHDFEKCFVCDVAFQLFDFDFKQQHSPVEIAFHKNQNNLTTSGNPIIFPGKNFQLRAPPVFMV